MTIDSGNLIRFKNAREKFSRDEIFIPENDIKPERVRRERAGRVTIGLALGSGAIRGFAHVGAISEFLKAGITIGEIAGSSIGAIIGCLFGAGMDASQIVEVAPKIGRERILDPGFPYISFFRGRKLKELLKYLFHRKLNVRRLEALKTKVFVTAVDILKGTPVIFREGDIVDVLMASCSVPMAFSPYEIAGGTYVDGGVLLPVPASILRGRGHEAIIGINLGFGNLKKNVGNIFQVSGQTIITMGRKLIDLQSDQSDITITPEFGSIGYWEFGKIDRIIKIGRQAAREAAPGILSRIRAVSSSSPARIMTGSDNC